MIMQAKNIKYPLNMLNVYANSSTGVSAISGGREAHQNHAREDDNAQMLYHVYSPETIQ